MRILHAGNANFGYVMARELRKRGIETDLLISKEIISNTKNYEIDASINDPLKHDKDLKEYPDWIHFADISKKTNVFKIAKFMRQYDIIHAWQATPIHAMLSGKPYIAGTGGDDLRKKAFEKSLTGFALKQAYKRANKVVYVWPILEPYVKKLKLKNAEYIPRIWDTNFLINQNKKIPDNTLRIFLPTLEHWKLKGNDKFLKAFVKLCKEKKDIFLYYVDWGIDSERAKEILSLPEIKGKVEVIKGPISREKMSEYMSNSDILADQFNSGSFTRSGIEAFNFGIPLLINIDEDIHTKLHGMSPPVINGKNEDDIYQQLKKYTESKKELISISDNAKKWAHTHFNLQKNIDRYVRIYEKILN
jgi:glycosyltransferase involved in cell wall biosynthesis